MIQLESTYKYVLFKEHTGDRVSAYSYRTLAEAHTSLIRKIAEGENMISRIFKIVDVEVKEKHGTDY